MRHTKPLSRQPAGGQLACRKRSTRVGLQPNLGLFQHGRRSSLVFHFICTRTFMSGPQTGVCVCFFCGDHLNLLCCDLLVGRPLDQVQTWSQPQAFDSPLGVNWRCYWSIHSGGIDVYIEDGMGTMTFFPIF